MHVKIFCRHVGTLNQASLQTTLWCWLYKSQLKQLNTFLVSFATSQRKCSKLSVKVEIKSHTDMLSRWNQHYSGTRQSVCRIVRSTTHSGVGGQTGSAQIWSTIHQQLRVPDLPPDVSLTDWASCPQQVTLVMMRPVVSTAQSIDGSVHDTNHKPSGGLPLLSVRPMFKKVQKNKVNSIALYNAYL